MNSFKILFASYICCIMFSPSCNNNKSTKNSNTDVMTINFKEMKHIGSIDERFQSYNVEMVEVVGGDFWKPYKFMDSLPSLDAASTYDVSQRNNPMYRKLSPIDLTDRKLVNLANGLAPAYVRVSGTWANAVYFQDNDLPAAKAPAGFVNVLTRSQWKGVIDFLKATDSKLVTSFAVSKGVRDKQGVWTSVEAQKLVDYTRSLGGEITAAELFNEPTMPTAGGEMDKNYGAEDFAKDVAAFNAWAKSKVPNMLTLGPGSVGEGSPNVSLQAIGMDILSTDAMMSAEPKPVFDVFTYHYYGAASVRMMRSGPFSIKAEHALDDAWLRKTDTVANFYSGLRDKYMPGKPLWITETGQAAAGGDPYAATFLDCFRYLYQAGSLAKKGVKVIMHNTLAASEYSLIDQDTHLPKPNYWAAFLWAKLMGTQVYDQGDGANGLYPFVHNRKGNNTGVTLLIINTNDHPATVNIPENASKYTLTSNELQGTAVFLNGNELKLGADDELPEIKGETVTSGNVTLPIHSISFFELETTPPSSTK